MVDIKKLWNNGAFQKLSKDSKLLYVYLTNNFSLNTAGVVCLNPEMASKTISMDLDSFRSATQELVNKKYIYVKAYDGLIYFIIPSHFSTLPSNGGTVEKIKSDMAGMPDELQDYLESIGISAGKKYKTFVKPLPEEIEAYCLSQGHFVDGNEVYNYYERVSKDRKKTEIWVDKNGTQIRDWKMKLKNVWCKPTNKLQKRDKAPKGFEYFFVSIDGKLYFPDGWRDDRPYSKDYSINRALNNKFNRI